MLSDIYIYMIDSRHSLSGGCLVLGGVFVFRRPNSKRHCREHLSTNDQAT